MLMGYAAPMSEDGLGVLKEKNKICLRDCQKVTMKVASSENEFFGDSVVHRGRDSEMPCDLGCGWFAWLGLLSQRAFYQSFLSLLVEDAVFFRVGDFIQWHSVDVMVSRGDQEEQECGQAEGPSTGWQAKLEVSTDKPEIRGGPIRKCTHIGLPASSGLRRGRHKAWNCCSRSVCPIETKMSGHIA